MSKHSIYGILVWLPLLLVYGTLWSQRPANGTYIYDVAFAEWNGQSNGATVQVKIQGDSVFVYHNGGNLSGKSGELLDCGIILWHKSNQWIIGHIPTDKNAVEVGGCSDGPSVIDFKKKTFGLC